MPRRRRVVVVPYRGSASKGSRVTGSVRETLFPEEDRAGGGGSPGRVGHVGRDNARFAAMSVSLRRCTVAVTYPRGAFVGCVLVAVTPLHQQRAKPWKRDCRIRA